MGTVVTESTPITTGGKAHHYASFREFVEALKKLGEVQEIDREVDWDLEMGAIITRTTQHKLPAPLFNKVKDSEEGLRALGAPGATSRQPGLYLSRLAIMAGMDPHSSGKEIVAEYVAAKDRPVQPPIIVPKEKAPCKERILLGDDIDLTKFPVPLVHDGDGGRYIQTAGINIVKSPDGKWTNWSVNRAMLVDKNHITGLVIPEQHIGMIHGMWKQQGKPTPWALALGVPPAALIAGGAPMAAYSRCAISQSGCRCSDRERLLQKLGNDHRSLFHAHAGRDRNRRDNVAAHSGRGCVPERKATTGVAHP
jgi:4-hydroxy-3-polyprenylbenzoate decarboxylase